jgi:hypothetical protein
MTNEVVSGGNALRDCVGNRATGLHESGSAPCVGSAGTAVFLNLEPYSPNDDYKCLHPEREELKTYCDSGIQLLQPALGHFAMYVMVGPT